MIPSIRSRFPLVCALPSIVGALLSILGAGPSWAGCLPLPSIELQVLDARAIDQPKEAASIAEQRLAARQFGHDPLYEAELYAIIADARAEESRFDAATVAVESSFARLPPESGSPDVSRLRLRLRLLQNQIRIGKSDSRNAVIALDKLMVSLPTDSLDLACALSVRAMAYDFLYESDRAVTDALTAYLLADDRHWTMARLETAYTLARNFRRAGLSSQAHQMMATLIEIGKAEGFTSLLSTVEFEEGQLLMSEGRFTEALAALETAKSYAAQVGDGFSEAAVDVPLCGALTQLKQIEAAEVICRSQATGRSIESRPDLAALMLGYGARLDLARDRPLAAIDKLNRLISPALHELLPAQEADFYRDRAAAFGSLGKYPLAYADYRQAHQLDLAANAQQRNRQVAVLSAIVTAEKLGAANRLLEDRLKDQQTDLKQQRESRRLWITATISCAVLGAMCAYLLTISRRHGRTLRRYGIILRSASSRAPDAIVLLDAERRVTFANRNFCGVGRVPGAGESLESAMPESILPVLTPAIDNAFRSGKAVSLCAAIADHSGSLRQYEIWVLPALDGPKALGVTLRSLDVTEARQLEREVIDSATLERQRLSNDLHEGLGQELVGVMLMVGNLSSVLKRGRGDVHPLVTEIVHNLSKSVDTIRSLAQGLAPVKIGSGSLCRALQRLVNDAGARFGIIVGGECCIDETLVSDLAADHLYRLCREGVIRAALHERCSRVTFSVRIDAEMLVLRIVNDGRGAASEPTTKRDDFGLRMMAYRARSLAGDLQVTETPAGGACIEVTLPMSQVASIEDARPIEDARHFASIGVYQVDLM